MYCSNACSDAAPVPLTRAAARDGALGDASGEREQILQIAAFGDLGVGAADIDPDGPGANRQRISVDLHVADDDLRCAGELADLDHGGAAEDRVRRQVELIVGALARGARDRAEPACVQVVGDQDGDRLAEPVRPTVASRRLERRHQNPRG